MPVRIGGMEVILKRIGRFLQQFRRLGSDNIIWQRPGSAGITLSPTVINFGPLGGSENVVLGYPNSIFSFTDIETNMVIPEGINVQEERRVSQGDTTFITFVVSSPPIETTTVLTDQILIRLNNNNMALTVTVNRSGQSDLQRIVQITPGEAPIAGGAQTFAVESIPAGATYDLTVIQRGTIDNTGDVTLSETTGTAALAAADATQHTLTWSANSVSTLRRVTVRATNTAVPSDFVELTFRQSANLPVNVQLQVSDVSPFIGENLFLIARAATGDAPLDFRIFRGDVTALHGSGSTSMPSAFTATDDLLASVDDTSNTTLTHTAIAVNGENTFTAYLRDSDGEVAGVTVTVYATPAYGYLSYSGTDSSIHWFSETSRVAVVLPGIPGTASISATVTGEGTGSVTAPTFHIDESDLAETWRVTVNWDTANPNRSSSRAAVVTFSYLGEPILGSFIVRQNELNSVVTPLTISDGAITNTLNRAWNDTETRQIGAAISNFPDDGRSGVNLTILANNILQTLNFTKISTTGVGDNRTIVVSRQGVTDEQLIAGGVAQGVRIILEGALGHYDDVSVQLITSTTITFTGASSTLDLTTVIGQSYSQTVFTQASFLLNLIFAPPSGVLFTSTGISVVSQGPVNYDATTPAGYKQDLSYTGVNSSIVSTRTNIISVTFRGALIGSFNLTRGVRPPVAQRLLINPNPLERIPPLTSLLIDPDNTFNTIIPPEAGATFDIYTLHDINHNYQSTTDGTGADFVRLMETNRNPPNSVALPTSFPSTVIGTNGDVLDSQLYARYTRIGYLTTSANGTTGTQSDNICININ